MATTDTASCDYCGAQATHAALSTPSVHLRGCPVPVRLRDADALIALLQSADTRRRPTKAPGASRAGRD